MNMNLITSELKSVAWQKRFNPLGSWEISFLLYIYKYTDSSFFLQNPMFANNPQLQEQIRTMMPQMLAQLQNPEMQQMMSNPQVS